MEKLSASEALFGFVAWLTTREETTEMSSRHDCAGLPDLVVQFCETNNLEEPGGDFPANLTHPS